MSLIYKLKMRRYDFLSPFLCGKFINGKASRTKYRSLDDLVDDHFSDMEDHPCRNTLHHALSLLGLQSALIVETGSSAWGANSTVLFDSYVSSFGGDLKSVDIRATPMFTLQKKCSTQTQLFCDDSVRFLQRLVLQTDAPRLFYLDSWDVDWHNPLPSMLHGLHEFLSIKYLLKRGDIILIDDTPINLSVLEAVGSDHWSLGFKRQLSQGIRGGKGSLVLDHVLYDDFAEVVLHDYQLLLRIK